MTSIDNMIHSSLVRNLSCMLLAPYVIGLAPDDSSYTEFAFGLGAGQYEYHDCSAQPHGVAYRDVGVRGTAKVGSFRGGLAVSLVTRDGVVVGVPYPDIAYDPGSFSIGTTGLRLGSLDEFYGEVSLLDQVPAFSGKGIARVGIGWTIRQWDTRLWLGMNAAPYQRGGWAAQVDFPVADGKYIFVNGRIGASNGISEHGVSVGVRLRK